LQDVIQTKPGLIVEESRNALQGIRRTLIEMYSAVGANPEKPQEVARKYGLNRNLTWKLSRVMTAQDPFSALNHLPGQQGMDLAVAAFEKAGAPTDLLDQVRDSMKRFIEVVDQHAGDRDQLELTLESMGLFEREYRIETGRELAYRGNCMIWGVQARVRMALALVGPQGPDTMSFVSLGGLIGFRRLRPNVRWRLMRMQIHSDLGNEPTDIGVGPIFPTPPGDPPFVIREFCSDNVPALEQVISPEGREIMLPGGPVGSQGACDCVFGYAAKGLSRYRNEEDRFASVAASILLPTEVLICDLLLHNSVELEGKPELLIYGFPHGGIDSPAAQSVQNQLPHNFDVTELVGSPPAVGTAHIPRYSRIVNRVYEHMGWKPDEFRGYRVQIPYPVMSSKVVLRWPLPVRPV